ncbi:MAG: VCBS repeat-containing protein [Chitinophagaceae bacterium]|nr:VCBS repeat-containing protein [Chitinophagaceae bacterium]
MNKLLHILFSVCCAGVLYSCGDRTSSPSPFTALDHERTGLDFENRMRPTPDFNLFSYMYFYNGAGIGAGDFNRDGRIDLYFASSQGRDRLYINRGDMKFQDVSDASGIPADSAWSTGVSVVDINADGWTDIYVCQVGQYKGLRGHNRLLINKGPDKNGIPVFRDEAAAYGLDFSGFSTQATFFDHDADGDLDLFLLNHSVNHDGNYMPRAQFEGTFDSLAGQRLYTCETDRDDAGNLRVRYRDISRSAGIRSTRIGYGLGVVVTDVDLDGRPDIYVGNDFHENDYLYMNQGDGTFREEASARLGHTSQFSMGVDAADINNDAWPDIVSMDMLPYDPELLRRSLSEDDYNIYRQKISYGYAHQYARNNLQLNRGDGRFREIGQFAGIHATDWSWAALLVDFDNDGQRDLFVSNGIPKRMNDIDYISFVSGEEMQRKLRDNALEDKDLALIRKFPEIKIPNRFFQNKGGTAFEDISDRVEGNANTFSNGSVYADLDNDGDLDLVVNNIDDPVLVYRNNTNGTDRSGGFLSVDLKGPEVNPSAIGARLVIFAGGQVIYHEKQPVRGFLSSMDIPLHAGLEGLRPDAAVLVWPDNTCQPVDLKAGPRISLTYRSGLPAFDFSKIRTSGELQGVTPFEDITRGSGLLHLHRENRFNEFDREPLMPQMVSAEGPAAAVGDADGDGLEDVWIGASKGERKTLWLQRSDGSFRLSPQPALVRDSMWEDADALWLDVDMDRDPDLVVATGGNEYYGNDEHQQPLLYLNDGRGNLQRRQDAFTGIFATQSRVASTDLNGDGYPDLFIAGRALPWEYGKAPRSFLLLNDGSGRFRDVTEAWCPDLLSPGMVTDAVWKDMNGDGRADLVLSAHWGDIEIYLRQDRSFVRQRVSPLKGWWQSLLVADLDLDGDKDIVAGNFGLNSRLRPRPDEPVRMYVHDFDENGRSEQLLTYHVGGREIPFASKTLLEKSLPSLKKRFLYAEDFARSDISELFGSSKLGTSMQLTSNTFESMVFLNEGDGRFKAMALPPAVQWSTIRSLTLLQANADSLPDILVWGNFHANNVEIGRQDAFYGQLLINVGGGAFRVSDIPGLRIPGQAGRVRPIGILGRSAFILPMNDDSLRVIRQVGR